MIYVTSEEKQRRIEEAKETTNYIIKESQKRGYQQAVDATKDVYEKFKQIELKDRCIRVRFLDWLSAKLLAWSQVVHQMSVRIDSPCVIRLPENKTEKSPYWTSKIGEKK
jgi:hypothetical protein